MRKLKLRRGIYSPHARIKHFPFLFAFPRGDCGQHISAFWTSQRSITLFCFGLSKKKKKIAMMDCFSSSFESVPSYGPLLKAAFSIPISHYFFGAFFIFLLCFCHFLEIHFFRDLLTGFAGQPVSLTFHSSSPVYHFVASKCKILHSRYSAVTFSSLF